MTKALGAGGSSREEHRVPPHIIINVIVISSCTAPEEDKVIDRVMHDWQHRSISNSDPTAGVNEDVNSRNR